MVTLYAEVTSVPKGQAHSQCGPDAGSGVRGASSTNPPWERGQAWGRGPWYGYSPRAGPPSPPSHSFVLCSEEHRGREARLRRRGQSAVTLRTEDPGPCARRETKATTKEVAAAGGGGGSFLSNRSAQPLEKETRPGLGGAGGGEGSRILEASPSPLRTARD